MEQLSHLVDGQRVPAILSNFHSNLSNQFFQSFQLLLRCFLAKADPNAGNRNAHFQQTVVDAGMDGILWVLYLIQRQVGGDDQRLPAAVSAVHDVVDNTLDFASKIVCQQGCCSPLLETQSQRGYAPLDTPPVHAVAIHPAPARWIRSCPNR